MINNNTIKNVTKTFPAVQGLVNNHSLGKILLKNIYQPWHGENILEIKDKHEDNPYSLRIGKVSVDKQMKEDRMYFIANYLAYNPFTRLIEKRELTSYRNMDVVYIGQSIEEQSYKDYKMFVDGKVVVDDLVIKKFDSLKGTTIGQLLLNLNQKIDDLQSEINLLKRQSKNNPIYTKSNS